MKTPYALAAVLAILIFLYCSACGNFSINDSKEGEDSAATYTCDLSRQRATSGTVPAYTKYYEAGQTVTVLVNSGGLMKTDYAFWAGTPSPTERDYLLRDRRRYIYHEKKQMSRSMPSGPRLLLLLIPPRTLMQSARI